MVDHDPAYFHGSRLITHRFVIGLIVVLWALGAFITLPSFAHAAEIDATKYFYTQLNSNEQTIYNKLASLKDTDVEFTLTLSAPCKKATWNKMIARAQSALCADNPTYKTIHELKEWHYPKGSNESAAQATMEFCMQPFWVRGSFEDERATAKRTQIVDTVKGGDRYTQIRKLCDYFRRNMEYDDRLYIAVYPGPSLYPATAMGPFCNGLGVSQGLAMAFKMVCDDLEIPCILVGNDGGIWTIVQMENSSWYAIDLTVLVASKTNNDWVSNILWGSSSPAYAKGAYCSSSPYIGRANLGFTFPLIASDGYSYSGPTSNFSYTDAPDLFDSNGSCAASGHRWGFPTTNPRSCKAAGAYIWTCSKCASKYEVAILEENNQVHRAGKTIKKGCFTETLCRDCGKVFNRIRWRACKYKSINDGFYKMQKCIYKGCNHTKNKVKVKLAAAKVKSVSPLKNGFVFRWSKATDKKVSYQVRYASNASFKGGTIIKVKASSASVLSKRINHLKGKQTYYVKVRAVKSGVSGGKKVTIYSPWSAAKSVKAK